MTANILKAPVSLKHLCFWVCACLFLCGHAFASDAQVCPADIADQPPQTWSGPDCITQWPGAVDPTDRLVWIRFDLNAPYTNAPLGLHIGGRFSSRIWINGREIGRNGLPGPDNLSEAPGLIDAVLAVPPDLVRPGPNEIIMLASAHHAYLDLYRPFQHIAFRPIDPTNRELAVAVAPVMVALGLFLAGLVYFGGLAALHSPRGDALLLCGLCGLASGQLLAEMTRPLWSYPYPLHDLRLLAIAGFSAGFGWLSCLYVTRRQRPGWLLPVMAAATLISIAALWLEPGFDGKSSSAMLGPLVCALLVSVWAVWRPVGSGDGGDERVRATMNASALTAFVLANLAAPELFLDAVFFYLVAAFLLVLLAEQVGTRARERSERLRETARADRLQTLIDRLEPGSAAPPLVIRSAGKIEQIPVGEITAIKGADGYAEIRLDDGRTVLHTKTLNALEAELPASFLRVHRSHIVNTARVGALDRDASGTGSLLLQNGERIPVSRRILPRVRQALG
ncbi:LytTR family transcriptional regulator DNA-binding domain-containing protein [uncultured Algimonas sp.]|uniref:LytR/AlgR family response regulator transcription factor n=1 Tax=uncultured Algimonas sp. TaxID=1547920 RepID=UPI0026287075|nr:LytTR family transcriptional regulator DNA-binding domain-containing protein [uncultured Algimonas sp.]